MEVEGWLRELYKSQKKTIPCKQTYNDVPSYEKNKTTHQILSNVKVANVSANFQAREEMKVMKVLTEENTAETARLKNILSALKLDLTNLPSELKSLVDIISTVSQSMEDLEDKDEGPCDMLPDIFMSQTQALQRLQTLEKVQEALNQVRIRDCHEQLATKKETEFLSKKIGEYAGHVRHMEKKLQSVDYDPNLRHSSLEKRYKELNLASEKLLKLKSKLDIYSDLTPDLNLAKIQVQNLKEELLQLENQITDNISNINSH